MSDDRRALLKRKAHRLLVSGFDKLLARPHVTVIDVEMFWPPDHAGIDFAMYFRPEAERHKPDWSFSIQTEHWRLKTDPIDDIPAKLDSDIQHLFRSAWKQASAKVPGARGYLRFHDSDYSVDLRSGRQIEDHKRPDYIEPERKPFSKTGHPTKKSSRNGELVRRGDPLSAVKTAYKTTEEPNPQQSVYFWPKRGIRIKIDNGKIDFVNYFAPFPDCVGGIWIGAHAWEVHEILGRAAQEFLHRTERLWRYDVDGFMSVGFDRHDRVSFIGR